MNILTGAPDLTAYLDTGFWDVGVVSVLKDRGIAPGKIIVGGFDLVPDVLAQMKADTSSSTSISNPTCKATRRRSSVAADQELQARGFRCEHRQRRGDAKDQVDAIMALSKNGYR